MSTKHGLQHRHHDHNRKCYNLSRLPLFFLSAFTSAKFRLLNTTVMMSVWTHRVLIPVTGHEEQQKLVIFVSSHPKSTKTFERNKFKISDQDNHTYKWIYREDLYMRYESSLLTFHLTGRGWTHRIGKMDCFNIHNKFYNKKEIRKTQNCLTVSLMNRVRNWCRRPFLMYCGRPWPSLLKCIRFAKSKLGKTLLMCHLCWGKLRNRRTGGSAFEILSRKNRM